MTQAHFNAVPMNKAIPLTHTAVRRIHFPVLRMISLKRALLYAGFTVLACALICLFFPGILINPFIEHRITRAIEDAYPGYTIRTTGLQYNIWENRLGCDSVSVNTLDSAPAPIPRSRHSTASGSPQRGSAIPPAVHKPSSSGPGV